MKKTRYLLSVAMAVALLASACAGDDGADSTRAPLTTIASGRDRGGPIAGGSEDRVASTTAAPATTAAPSDTTIAASRGAGDDHFAIRAPERRIPDEELPPPSTFTSPREDDLSTFAVDVDTGAYTIMRAQLDSGYLPDPNTVRVEEFVNYFNPGYAPPTQGTFAVYADGGPTPFTENRSHDVVRIGVKAREVTPRQRKDLNLTLVIDVSGSMREDDKLEVVKDALEVLVDELDRADTVAIVAYTDEAWLALEPVDGGDKDEIMDVIRDLRPLRSTNAEAGLQLGYDQADAMYDRDAQNRVVLLSDGVANVGNTGPEGILSRIDAETRRGIDLVTVGVGISNYNDALLEQLADQGDGFYAYVDTRAEAERLFQERLTSTFETVARDVKVQVWFDPEQVDEYRLLGFENRDIADRDFRNDSVDAGEIGAGHTVVALYEVALARGAYSRNAPAFAEVSLRWEDADTGRIDEITGEIYGNTLSASFGRSQPEFQLAATVAAFAEVLQHSGYRYDFTLRDIVDVANDLPLRELDADADEFIDLVNLAFDIAR